MILIGVSGTSVLQGGEDVRQPDWAVPSTWDGETKTAVAGVVTLTRAALSGYKRNGWSIAAVGDRAGKFCRYAGFPLDHPVGDKVVYLVDDVGVIPHVRGADYPGDMKNFVVYWPAVEVLP
jgi:hypothetical protein